MLAVIASSVSSATSTTAVPQLTMSDSDASVEVPEDAVEVLGQLLRGWVLLVVENVVYQALQLAPVGQLCGGVLPALGLPEYPAPFQSRSHLINSQLLRIGSLWSRKPSALKQPGKRLGPSKLRAFDVDLTLRRADLQVTSPSAIC